MENIFIPFFKKYGIIKLTHINYNFDIFNMQFDISECSEISLYHNKINGILLLVIEPSNVRRIRLDSQDLPYFKKNCSEIDSYRKTYQLKNKGRTIFTRIDSNTIETEHYE